MFRCKKKLLAVVGCTLSLLWSGIALAQSSEQASTSLAVKMAAFDMPAEYNCPLFSNSPYTDLLNSLDRMQTNLNSVFKTCESKTENLKINEVSNSLHKKVLEAQMQQQNGQTFKLDKTAASIVELTRNLQQGLVALSQAQTKACYRSESEFRNVIFSINDTFQSISPLILDIASQNPGIGQMLGPALKILAGADAISKGLSLIEQIAKDSVQFDMSDKDNRINTIKNTCQFMKLYNRLSYLRLSRLGQVQAIHNKYQTEISELNRKILYADYNRNSARSTPVPAAAPPRMMAPAMGESTAAVQVESIETLFARLKASAISEQSKIQKILGDFEEAKSDNFAEITQCQLVKNSMQSYAMTKFIEDLENFADRSGSSQNLGSDLSVVAEYQKEIEAALNARDRKLCTGLGQDWLKKIDQLFLTARQMIAVYEQKLIERNGEAYLVHQKKLAKDMEKLKTAQSDYKNLKTMLIYAAFESSEVEKRAHGMHKYLFAGPDKVESECRNRSQENACNALEGTAGLAKAYYQEYRNQGPVYELILNNENHFERAHKRMFDAMNSLIKYADQFLPKSVQEGLKARDKKTFDENFILREKHVFELEHMTQEFIAKGSALHTQICSQSKLLVSEYLKATSHMMSTAGMCEMIKNVLSEPEVSPRLKAYCLPVKDNEESGLNKMRQKLVGQADETSKKSELQVIYFSRSPKAFVDQLIVKMKELECYN